MSSPFSLHQSGGCTCESVIQGVSGKEGGYYNVKEPVLKFEDCMTKCLQVRTTIQSMVNITGVTYYANEQKCFCILLNVNRSDIGARTCYYKC